MSNFNDNKLSVTLTPADIANSKSLLNQLPFILPFLKGLSPEDRQTIPKISVSNKVFVEDTIAAAQNNLSFLPAYLNIQEIQKDLTLYMQLDELVLITSQLSEKLRDTQMIAGSEAYVAALTIYRLFEAAARAGMPGADAVFESLRSRFQQSPAAEDKPVV